ncbi:unnamed protein product [Orchesella dallaii]
MRRKQRKPEQVISVDTVPNNEITPAPEVEVENKGRKRKRSLTPLADVILQSSNNPIRATRSSMKTAIAILESEINDDNATVAQEPTKEKDLEPKRRGRKKLLPLQRSQAVEEVEPPTPAISELPVPVNKIVSPVSPTPQLAIKAKTAAQISPITSVPVRDAVAHTPSIPKQPATETVPSDTQLAVENKPSYKVGDKVLCLFHNLLYDAVIQEIHPLSIYRDMDGVDIDSTFRSKPKDTNIRCGNESTADEFGYLIHYPKWKTEWDEWVRSDVFIPITDETRRQQLELKKLSVKNTNKKFKKSAVKKKRKSLKGLSKLVSTNKSEVASTIDNLEDGKDKEIGTSALADVTKDNLKENTDGTLDQNGNNEVRKEIALSESGETKNKSDMKTLVEAPVKETLNQKGTNKRKRKRGRWPTKSTIANKSKAAKTITTNEKNLGTGNAGPSEGVISSNLLMSLGESQGVTTDQKGEDGSTAIAENGNKTPLTVKPAKMADKEINSSELESKEKNEEPVKDIGSQQEDAEENIKAKQVHPVVQSVGFPTVSAVIHELLPNMLQSGHAKATAHGYTIKLRMFYDYFCHCLIAPVWKKDVLRHMADNNLKNYSDVVHCSGLLAFIEWIEAGRLDWKPEYCKKILEDEIVEIRQIFEFFKVEFDLTKKFVAAKCESCTMGADSAANDKTEVANSTA